MLFPTFTLDFQPIKFKNMAETSKLVIKQKHTPSGNNSRTRGISIRAWIVLHIFITDEDDLQNVLYGLHWLLNVDSHIIKLHADIENFRLGTISLHDSYIVIQL